MIAIRPLHAVAAYGRMIKFSHSVFALPFALSGAAMAATRSGVTLSQIGWIALAMVGARSAAMGFNRLADRHIDAANPRTSNRELPQGVVSPSAVSASASPSRARRRASPGTWAWAWGTQVLGGAPPSTKYLGSSITDSVFPLYSGIH